MFLNSLDDSVFDVLANFGLTPQMELAVAIVSLMTECEPVQNVSITQWIFRARYQWTRRRWTTTSSPCGPFKKLLSPSPMKPTQFYCSNSYIWLGTSKSREFLTKEPNTLDEAREVARLKEEFADAVLLTPFDVMSLSSCSKKARDANTQTDANGGSYYNSYANNITNKGYNNQWWFNKPYSPLFQWPTPSKKPSQLVNTVGPWEYRLSPTFSLS